MGVASQDSVLQALVVNAKTEAKLCLGKDVDRAQVTACTCKAALATAGVQYTRQVEDAIAAFLQNLPPPGESVELVVARATPPVPGEDAQLTWLVQEPGEHCADTSYYDRRGYVAVQSEQVIGRLTRETAGEDGRDVTGATLPAKSGKPCAIQLDDSIVIDAQGQLIAQRNGVLIRDAASARIEQLLELSDYVDFSTGHVEFDGNVQVGKGVRDNFRVQATGDIVIAGLVEAATVLAGGNLTLLGGVAGREQGRVQAGGDLKANYLHSVAGEIGGVLEVSREINTARLIVHGQVASPQATLIGGSLLVVGPAQLKTVGSGAGVLTQVVLGRVPRDEYMLARIQDLLERLKARRKNLEDERDAIAARPGRPDARQRERQTELIYEIQQCLREAEKAARGQMLVRQRIEQTRTVDLRVERQLFHGTVLEIDGQHYRLRQDLRGPVHITAELPGDVFYQQGSGERQVLTQVAEPQGDAAELRAAS